MDERDFNEPDSYDEDFEDAYFDGEDLDEDLLYALHEFDEDELEEF
jgi:hypothetical protein